MNFEKGNFEQPEQEKDPEYWLERAQDKVLSFLPDLDMDLNVGFEARTIYPYNGQPYDGIVLVFKHEKNPRIQWTMDIGQDEDYIENHLEEVVRKIYAEQYSQGNNANK